MKKNNTGLDISYDKENGVLYISFGAPRSSYCDAEIDDVFVMKDMLTDEYSGFTILDFSKRLNDGSLYELNLPFSFDLKGLGKQFPFTASH